MDEFEVSLTQEEINAIIGMMDVVGEEEEALLERVANEIGVGPSESAEVINALHEKLYEFYVHPDALRAEAEDRYEG